MGAEKSILRTVPTIQAVGLVKRISKRKKFKPVKSFLDITIGTALLREEAALIESL